MSKKKASSSTPSSSSRLGKDDILGIVTTQSPIDLPSILVSKYMDKKHISINTVPSVYTSYFFRKDIITQFYTDVINSIPRDKLPTSPLNIFKLYNKDDIINNLTFNSRPELRPITSSRPDRTLRNNLKSVMTSLIGVCSNIGDQYIRDAFNNTIQIPEDINNSNFDILVISTNIIEDVTKDFDARISGIGAFIIVQLGECEKYPKAISINLICAKAGTGSLLMAAYLYTILSHPIDTSPNLDPIDLPTIGIRGEGFLNIVNMPSEDGSDIYSSTFGSTDPLIPIQDVAVLELASAYENTGGLCMYEKFGFEYDPTMYTDATINCFNDRNNLPMKIDFTNNLVYGPLPIHQKKQRVVEILTERVKNVFTKSLICNLRGQLQELLGYLKSIYLFRTQGGDMRKFSINIPSLTKKLDNLSSTNPNIIPDLITYLENKARAPSSLDSNKETIIAQLITSLPPGKTPAPTPVSAPSPSPSSPAPSPSSPAPSPASSAPSPAPAPAPVIAPRRSSRLNP